MTDPILLLVRPTGPGNRPISFTAWNLKRRSSRAAAIVARSVAFALIHILSLHLRVCVCVCVCARVRAHADHHHHQIKERGQGGGVIIRMRTRILPLRTPSSVQPVLFVRSCPSEAFRDTPLFNPHTQRMILG